MNHHGWPSLPSGRPSAATDFDEIWLAWPLPVRHAASPSLAVLKACAGVAFLGLKLRPGYPSTARVAEVSGQVLEKPVRLPGQPAPVVRGALAPQGTLQSPPNQSYPLVA